MPDRGPDDDAADGVVLEHIALGGAGARAAEQLLHDRYALRIRLYGLRHLGDDDAASDLVQQVMLAVIEAARAGRIENPERVGAFVLGTCRYAVWDRRRGEQRARQAAAQEAAVQATVLEADLHPIDRVQLERCVGNLPARESTVVRMSFHEDRPAQEIADLLGLTAGNVRVIRHRALSALRRCLEGA